MTTRVLRQVKGCLLGAGIALLIASGLVLVLMLVGFLNFPAEVIAGESTIHSVARIAITGCLLAAVGSQE